MHNRLRLKLSGMVLLAIVVASCGEGGGDSTVPLSTPELLVTTGTASLNGELVERNQPVPIAPDDEIAVQELSVAFLRVPGLFSFQLFMNGSMQLEDWNDEQITALLKAGHVEFRFDGQSEAQLQLETAQGSLIETLGNDSVFTACEPSSGLTCLTVEQGSVRLEAGGKSTTYSKGEGTSTGAFLNEDKTPSEAICIPDEEFEAWFDDARSIEGTLPLGMFVTDYPFCDDPITERIEVEVPVPAINLWTDTGVDLKPEDLLVIEAGGMISHGRSGAEFGPEGNDNPEVRANNVPGLEDENHAALIGRIGENGVPFVVGTDHGETVEATGRLFLGVNDTLVEDNNGEFTALVTVVPS
jgi:hypothetical protein